jgi:D-alanyl-D-alanine carboxypeptidase
VPALLGLAMVLGFVSEANAADKSAVLVIDGNSGRVLHQSAADEPRHPASLAKMMTLYLVFELIEQGRLNYQTRLTISPNAAAAAPSKLDLDAGEQIALIDAIKVLVTKSANDIAVAIAEHVAGSEERFARLMTKKARELGMPATIFRNASGLPDEEQVTTARDMATLALRLQDDFPRHYPLFATRTFTYKDETFRNHNSLLFHYQGTDGLKTGYTRASGFNLVASVRRGRKHVIGVVFGGATASSRNAAMRAFLNMGLVKASSEKTRRPALIARTKPEAEPTLAAVPTPQRVERPAARPEPPPQAAALPTPPPPVPYPVQIARVRPVQVTSNTPASDRGSDPSPSIEAVIERMQTASAEPTKSPPDGMPPLAAPRAEPARLSPAAAADRPALMAEPVLARGSPPSTFEQQAANLARGEPAHAGAPQPAVRRPEPSVAGVVAGGFQIQIGAFQSASEAERQLTAVRERAAGLLAAAPAITQQVKQGDKILYRARYAGFNAQASAATVCTELKRLKVDCLVMKAE